MHLLWMGLMFVCFIFAARGGPLQHKRDEDNDSAEDTLNEDLGQVAYESERLAYSASLYVQKADDLGLTTAGMRRMAAELSEDYERLQDFLREVKDHAAQAGTDFNVEVDTEEVIRELQDVAQKSQTDLDSFVDESAGQGGLEQDGAKLVAAMTVLKALIHRVDETATSELPAAKTREEVQEALTKLLTDVKAIVKVANAIRDTANDADDSLYVLDEDADNEENLGKEEEKRDLQGEFQDISNGRQRRQWLSGSRFQPRPQPSVPRLPGGGTRRFNFPMNGGGGSGWNVGLKGLTWTNSGKTTTFKVSPNPWKPSITFTHKFNWP